MYFVVQADSSIQLKVENKLGRELASTMLSDLDKIPDKRIRVLKFGDEAKIKNVFFY